MATMTEIPGDLRTIAAAARETGVPERRIRFWADDGKIRKWRRSGHWVLVSLEDVRRMDRIEPEQR